MNDLISRQAAIDAIERNAYRHTYIDQIVGIIKELPSVQERKKGMWIEIDDKYRISGKCSVCGWEAHLYEDDVVGMPYCPNCGASMMEGAEE